MGPLDSVRRCLRRYVDMSGRVGRAEFWWFVGFAMAAMALAGVVGSRLGVGSPFTGQALVVDGQIVTLVQYYQPGWLQLAVALTLTPPLISVQVRRLHDRGRSGWWWWLNALNVFCCLGTLMLVFVVFIHPSVPRANAYGVPAERSPVDPGSPGGPCG